MDPKLCDTNGMKFKKRKGRVFSLNDACNGISVLSNSIHRICLIEMKSCGMQRILGGGGGVRVGRKKKETQACCLSPDTVCFGGIGYLRPTS